ncbi:uncharacterized protein LOC118198152 [Stegodyphus dumicola]|uniref:uncharacterized protein LOC118198152 n=1 Tax=Stegodyphus dumicola TaxID=202533 RepID=UPI0015AFEC0E|nr:uncharacterized protein LOC118198152 [Stegodyphus dumicola]
MAAAVLAGIMPLHIKAEQEAAITQVTLLRQQSFYRKQHYIPAHLEEKRTVRLVHPAEYDRGVHAHIDYIACREDNSKVCIYTDGSKIDNQVGCSFIAKRQGDTLAAWKGNLKGNNSVFQAEAATLKHALSYAATNSQNSFRIYTDSQSAIFAIRNPHHPSPLIAEIQALLRARSSASPLPISWIKAHFGHQGNEEADLLAKEAVQNIDAQQIEVLLPKSSIKRTTWKDALIHWQENWDSIPQGRRTYDFFHRVSTDRLISDSHITRFVTGHGPFPSYFYYRRLRTTNVCGDVAKPDHYLTSCPLTRDIHHALPTTNTVADERFMVKQPLIQRKVRLMMQKLEALGTEFSSAEHDTIQP